MLVKTGRTSHSGFPGLSRIPRVGVVRLVTQIAEDWSHAIGGDLSVKDTTNHRTRQITPQGVAISSPAFSVQVRWRYGRWTSSDWLSSVLGAICHCPGDSKGRSRLRNRLKSGERRQPQFDAAIAFRRAAGVMDRRRSGRPRLIAIIVGASIDLVATCAVFAVCITPLLLAAMIIGS